MISRLRTSDTLPVHDGDPTDGGPTGDPGSWFELLADRRRRNVLRYLAGIDGAVPLAELAEELALQETSTDLGVISDHGGPSPEVLQEVRIALRHVHVPKLEAANVVEYDAATRSVSVRDAGLNVLARFDAICRPPRDH